MTNKRMAKRTLRLAGAALAAAIACAATAQTVSDQQVPDTGLNLPNNLQIFGKVDPNVRKATAIVNDVVITGTDVDQRVNLVIAAQAAQGQPLNISDEDKQRLRVQILRQLIDETLQIQEAKSKDITIEDAQVNASYIKVARNFGRTADEMSAFLRASGSSDRSLKQQVRAQMAWESMLRRRVSPNVNVSEEEVNAIIERMKASKGTEEYHLKEIYLASNNGGEQTYSNAQRMMEQIQKGQPFEYFAHNFSDASTRATDGDLDWIRAAQLPDALASAAATMQVGQIAGPIEVPGGFSLLYLVDKRQVLMADPRNAKLALRQMTIHLPAGATKEQQSAQISEFAKVISSLHGCGDVPKAAQSTGAEVVDSDTVALRDLPPRLQEIVGALQIGQATPPFGTPEDGIRALVLCGRDEAKEANLPNAEELQAKMEEDRVNLRAQRMLRDLRRDAVIEYR